MDRNIIHMHLDAFFASVDCKLHPKLEGKPILVGGSSQWAVAVACSYEARRFGVHSPMLIRLAMQLCSDAKLTAGDMEAYSQQSHMITEIITEEAPCLKKLQLMNFTAMPLGATLNVSSRVNWI